jgi:membrane fusion protein (multidrug efflux system)
MTSATGQSTSEKRRFSTPVVIAAGALAVLVGGGLLLMRADSKVNKVSLSSTPKPVSVVTAKASTYRESRTFVGRLDPWVSANIGPQFVSAYVDTVLVRPGTSVKKGQVLATLDCRNANAAAQAVAMQARALSSQQKALADESARVTSMLDGGFVSPNEAEQRYAMSSSKESELLAQNARLVGTALEVSDCILRAPFDGDVATRTIDPGAFVRPGTALVSVVDRTTIRMTADVPETDFDHVAPGTKVSIHIYATDKQVDGTIARRAPAADPGTRTVHIEVDIPDPNRTIPVGTTGELHVDVGEPEPATELPLVAASIRGTKATFFAVKDGVAHTETFVSMGEIGGWLYVKSSDLPAGTQVVTEGRALLKDGDPVAAKMDDSPSPQASAGKGTTP